MKILMSAYACGPGRGSEPGAGWAWACAAARDHEVWVLTHENNRAPVTEALAADPHLAARLHPVFLGNARWARPLRRRGPTRFLYYLVWQITVCRRSARRLHQDLCFDIAHHVTYASDWLPSGVSGMPGVPFVWGPVGGSSTIGAPRLCAQLGARVCGTEAIRAALLTVARATIGRATAARAAVILAQNADVEARFGSTFNVVVEPNIVVDGRAARVERRVDSSEPPLAVFVGRLLGWKGLRLGLKALTLPEAAAWRLDVYGDGQDRRRLERVAVRWGLANRVRFLGHRPRTEIEAALSTAGVLLFPSIHDAAGWSVAEALEAGCPVVALDVGGPATLLGDGDGVLVAPGPNAVADLARALDIARRADPRPGRWSADRLPALLRDIYGGLASSPVLSVEEERV